MYKKIDPIQSDNWFFAMKLSHKAMKFLDCRLESKEEFAFYEIVPKDVYCKVEFDSGNIYILGSGSHRSLMQHAKTFDYNISNSW